MAQDLNRVMIIGRLGADPEVRRLNSGDNVVSLRVATSESWRDKSSGQKKEKTEWHNVVIYNEGLGRIAEDYLKKGSQVFIEGKIQTRMWEKDGEKRYATEIVLQNFNGSIQLLGGRADGDGGGGGGRDRDDRGGGGRNDRDRDDRGGSRGSGGRTASRDMDDEIPFNCEWRI